MAKYEVELYSTGVWHNKTSVIEVEADRVTHGDGFISFYTLGTEPKINFGGVVKLIDTDLVRSVTRVSE